MVCCELVKVNLTIIVIQRITHAFACEFDCAFDKSNLCESHSNAQHSNAHSNAFAFVNKPYMEAIWMLGADKESMCSKH